MVRGGICTVRGTSPPIRGIPPKIVNTVIDSRNIPAHTGNSSHTAPPQSCTAEHPRPYGEFAEKGIAHESYNGTSPPIRGIRPAGTGKSRVLRNIPAHTGNSDPHDDQVDALAEHPRPYGEFFPACLAAERPFGTSPPIRGIRGRCAHVARLDRNIPAHTGNSIFCRSLSHVSAEHPRPYGEFQVVQGTRALQVGTSPPIRGIQNMKEDIKQAQRNIPAHTGNSGTWAWRWRMISEHPRPYGEFHSCGVGCYPSRGTSPPIRGIRAYVTSKAKTVRNIPAHTGNSCKATPTPARGTEHPRPYGEFGGC